VLRGLALAAFLLLALSGCGEDPKPDREQIRDLVDTLFDAAAADDAEGVCAVLTEDGWAHAVQRHFVDGEPVRHANEDDCVREHAPVALKSVDLPYAMKHGYRPTVDGVRIRGDRATAIVTFTAFSVRWHFRRTGDGWKIDDFLLPVRE
jgi:hypothetical protein